MSAKYLLPCRCGKSVVVEPRQAGETTACSCGTSLQIPTMLAIIALEPAPDDSNQPRTEGAWGWHHRMLLLGITLLLAAMALAVLAYRTRPVAPIDLIDPVKMRQSTKNMEPTRTWYFWGLMKRGLDRRINQQYADEITIYHLEQQVAGVCALAGLVLIGVGATMWKKQGNTKAGGNEDDELSNVR